jgi:hypothetical protein
MSNTGKGQKTPTAFFNAHGIWLQAVEEESDKAASMALTHETDCHFIIHS